MLIALGRSTPSEDESRRNIFLKYPEIPDGGFLIIGLLKLTASPETPTISGSTNLDHIIINTDGTFTFTTSNNTIINYNTCNIALSDNSTYTNSYLFTEPYEFNTVIGNINANVSPIKYTPDISESYTITIYI
jgi:hypothetical protein